MVNATTMVSANQTSALTNAVGNKFGVDVFLKLLITQLRNQDPMQPMEDKEFIAQLAQFSSLEQMSAVKTSMQTLLQSQAALQAVGLVGRNITWADPDSGKNLSGKVESVDFQSGMPLLKVQDKEIPLGYVINVS